VKIRATQDTQYSEIGRGKGEDKQQSTINSRQEKGEELDRKEERH